MEVREKSPWRSGVIRTVIRIGNNMVIVFDDEGEQMPEYQGWYEDVRGRIMSDAPAWTVFNHWFGLSLEPQVVVKTDW